MQYTLISRNEDNVFEYLICSIMLFFIFSKLMLIIKFKEANYFRVRQFSKGFLERALGACKKIQYTATDILSTNTVIFELTTKFSWRTIFKLNKGPNCVRSSENYNLGFNRCTILMRT